MSLSLSLRYCVIYVNCCCRNRRITILRAFWSSDDRRITILRAFWLSDDRRITILRAFWLSDDWRITILRAFWSSDDRRMTILRAFWSSEDRMGPIYDPELDPTRSRKLVCVSRHAFVAMQRHSSVPRRSIRWRR